MNNYNLKSNKKAFTLIELLIVIAIIGILFIVLVSRVDFATDKAKATGVQTTFKSFQVAFETVSKENAGFNTFGWDTGDNAGAAPSGYTYTNADKDKGDRIRNSYDVGDINLNGQYDDDEVWTGRKIYTENWTGCYTLINPGNASDMSAIFDLETAINKNLDPKLHINIADDGTISMANGLKDPWTTQYHGQYITNASADAAAKWNTDASMAGSAGDNMDRGAILMYSNGANQKFGTKVKIEKGVVTTTVSKIDADHPDNNKMGADDYVLAVVYTYTNGYGETGAITEGFSNNQSFLSNYSNAVNVIQKQYTMLEFPAEPINVPEDLTFRSDAEFSKFIGVKVNGEIVDSQHYTAREGSTIVTLKSSYVATLENGINNVEILLQDGSAKQDFVISFIDLPAIKESLNAYSWEEIQIFAKAGLTNEQYAMYNIYPGSTKIVDSTIYYLVDLDGNNYNGFVFMYDANTTSNINGTSQSNKGGYANSKIASTVEDLYNNLIDLDLKNVIKQVTIQCNDGQSNYSKTHAYSCHMFLPAAVELGEDTYSELQKPYIEYYQKEGSKFDYFKYLSDPSSTQFMKTFFNGKTYWTRSAVMRNNSNFHTASGQYGNVGDVYSVTNKMKVMPCFVIG
jgi:prepilin-type N-terminal cleavage/methylation domain-containing protein